jgi:hypothetical protein
MNDETPTVDRTQRASLFGTLAVVLSIFGCIVMAALFVVGSQMSAAGVSAQIAENISPGTVSPEELQAAQTQTSIGSILALGGMVIGVVGGISTLVLAVIGLRQKSGSRGKLIAGLVFGILLMLIPAVFFILSLFLVVA